MRKLVFLMMFAITFVGCGHQKNGATSTKKSAVVENLPSHINFSNSFRAFWNDFYKDTKGAKTLENYVPSEAFQKHPAISSVDSVFVVSGYLTITSAFDQAAFEALGGTITTLDATTVTFKCH